MNVLSKRWWVPLLVLTLATLGCAAAQQVAVVSETPESRVVRHALGETEVPADPERIVSLSFTNTDNLLALGLRPVASETYGDGFAYLEPLLEGVAPVGYVETGYNLEAVLAARPDLILIQSYGGELFGADYAQLSRIAPTVVLESHDRSYLDRLDVLDLGVILGMEEEARARLEETDAKIAQAREVIRAGVGDANVALVNVRERELRLYGGEGYGWVLYQHGLGLTPPELTRELALNTYAAQISLETIPQLADAEHIFFVVSDDGGEAFTRLTGTPLWQNLPAVQAGNVYTLDAYSWLTMGTLADEGKVEDVREALLRTP